MLTNTYSLGEFKLDKLNGFGLLRYANDDIYEGYFVDNLRSGYGTLTLTSAQEIYKGQFKNHMKHGVGEYRYGNGDVYIGIPLSHIFTTYETVMLYFYMYVLFSSRRVCQ